MDDLDFQTLAMLAGFFIAGFVAVWVFLTLRQGEKSNRNGGEDGAG